MSSDCNMIGLSVDGGRTGQGLGEEELHSPGLPTLCLRTTLETSCSHSKARS